MAPVRLKEQIIVLLDIGLNSAKYDSSGKSFLQNAKECLSRIIQRKIFSQSKDEIALIVIGSEETKNPLADEEEFIDQYQNIAIIANLKPASWSLLQYIESVEHTQFTADWLDAIVVALDYIRNNTETKLFSGSKIVLLSNLDVKLSTVDQADSILAQINKMEVQLVVIGPNVLQNCDEMKHNMLVESIKDPDKTDNQIASERLVARMVTNNHIEDSGVICSFDDALPQLMCFQRKAVRPVPWNADFIISQEIKIPISGYKKVGDLAPVKWTDESIDDKNVLIEKDRAYVSYDAEKGEEIKVEKSDTIDAYKFGETLVPFSQIDKEAMNYRSGNKGLYLLGCTSKENVPLHMFMGSGNYVITGRKNDQRSKVLVEAFAIALSKQNKVGIAKKLYRTDSAVFIGALFPVVNKKPRYLVYVELPFAEDERLYIFPSLKTVAPRTDTQKKTVSDLIDAMNLNESDPEMGKTERFDPSKTYNPRDQYLYRCLAFKGLHPDEPIPENLVDTIKPMLQPPSDLLNISKPILEKIREVFNLMEISEPKRKKFKPNVDDVKEEPLNENVPIESVTKIGTLYPDKDFENLVSQNIPFDKLCQEMQDVIVHLLTRSTEDIEKPLSALKVLRKSCLLRDPAIYNNWMFAFKDFVKGINNNTAIWNALTTEKLGLIRKDESQDNGINNEDSEEFFSLNTTASSKMEACTMDELWDEL